MTKATSFFNVKLCDRGVGAKMADEQVVIGPKIPETAANSSKSRLISKLNHFFDLKTTKGLSLNQQLAAHPDFHAPGITETLLDVMGLDPWGSNLPTDVAQPFWEHLDIAEGGGQVFDYLKVAAEQRQIWESRNPQVMNAKPSGNPTNTMTTSTGATNSRNNPFVNPSRTSQQPRKRI